MLSNIVGKQSVNKRMARYRIELLTLGSEFSCPAEQPILKAMTQLGVKGIPSGCHGGGCGVCKIRIVRGRVRADSMSCAKISEAEVRDNVYLACKTYPLSTLTIEPLKSLERPLRKYGLI